MTEQVAQHYGKGGLLDRILAALTQAGKDIDHLTIDDLAPVDEFHSRRRAATLELSRLLAPSAGDHVIDIGSGIGGPARYLAAPFGCRVSGMTVRPLTLRALSRIRGSATSGAPTRSSSGTR